MTSSPPVREHSRFFLQLLPSLALAVFVTAFFWWNPFGRGPQLAHLEVLMRSEKPGTAQLIADVDGTGLRKEKTVSVPVPGGGDISHIHFDIPAGKLRAFIFTPRAEEGDVDVLRCVLTTEDNEVVGIISPTALLQVHPEQAQPLPDGAFRFHSRMAGAMAGLQFNPEPPIDLAIVPPPPAWQLTLVFLVTLCAAPVFSRNLLRLPWRRWVAAAGRQIRLRPRLAILACALFSAVLSCFPVVFCGMSFVSPDNGMQTLYEGFPGVPGAQGGRVENPVGSDMGAMLYWHMPASMIQHRAIFEDHEFPFWNRYNWDGVSLWAQCISMLGDPLHWPAVITGGAAWAWDLKFVLAKILFALGVGLMVRASSRSLAASLLLTLSAPWMGFFAYRFCHAAFFALSYAPWVLLPWLEAARATNRRSVAWWAVLLMFANWWQLNSGTAKESSAFLVFLNGAGLLTILLASNLSARERAVRLGIFAWASALFLLLSAPLWMPFLEALGKAATYYDPPKVCQIQPGLFIGAFDDIFHRQLNTLEFLNNPSTNFFVLLGAAWALVRVRSLVRDASFLATFLAAIGAAAVAFGVVSPDLLAQVPMIKNIYHFDNTFSCVLFILLFVVAGFGLRECRRRMRSPEWIGDWWMVIAIVAVLWAAFLGLTQAAHRSGITFNAIGHSIPKSDFMWQYGGAITVALAVFPWAWRAVRGRAPAAAVWFVVGACAFAVMHFRHGMYLETRFDIYTMNPKKRLDLRVVPSPSVEQIKRDIASRGEPGRVVGLDWLMTPGFNTVLGLETISGPDALQNPAVRELSNALGLPQMWFWKIPIWNAEFAEHHKALDFLGVRYYLDKPGSGAGLPGLKLLGTTDLEALESPTAWPRAFFTDTVATYEKLREMRILVEGTGDRPFAAVLPKTRAALPGLSGALADRKVVPATNYHLTQNTTSFEINAPSPGLAVLGEAWVPGDMFAFIDGIPAQVLRVNHAFRGVYIQNAGSHRVEFGYWPGVMSQSLWVFFSGLVCALATIWLWWRRTPAEAGTVPADSTVRELLNAP
jgi:hypothetical protein